MTDGRQTEDGCVVATSPEQLCLEKEIDFEDWLIDENEKLQSGRDIRSCLV